LKQTSGGTPPASPSGLQNTPSIGCGTLITDTVTITVDPVSVGGTLAGTTFVCYGTNSSTLTLSGHTGTIIKWVSSTDNWVTTVDIANTATTYTATNLTTTTKYRVLVQSGVCPEVYSSGVTVNVYDEFKVGSIAADQTICYNTTPEMLTSVSPTGGATPYFYQWQSSTDNINFSDILVAGTGTTYSPPALTETTYYRLVQTDGGIDNTPPSGLQNGAITGCGTLITDTVTIAVDPMTVAGFVFGEDIVCSGTNSTTLTLSGHTGIVKRWKFSTDNWVTSFDVANTTTSLTATNLTQTTSYLAVVQSGVCAELSSNYATITVEAGTGSASLTKSPDVTNVCEGTEVSAALVGGNGGLYQIENMPLVNSPGTGFGGTDASITSLEINSAGSNCNFNQGYSLAEDFVITGTTPRHITTFEVYAYQTLSNYTTSTITSAFVRIWDGNPSEVGSSVIYGDLATNTLSETTFANVFRLFWNSSPTNTDRPLYKIVCSLPGLVLDPGNYWIEWSLKGDVSKTGPWSPYRTITGQSVTGNALQRNGSTWYNVAPSPNYYNQGIPFILTGPGEDSLVSRTKTGIVWSSWSDYYSGDPISTTGKSGVEIMTIRKGSECSEANPTVVSWIVDPTTVGGAVTADADVCIDANSTLLTLSGHTGTILGWEYSNDNFVTTVAIANTLSTYTVTNIVETRKYRALVQSGVCTTEYSTPATITVHPLPEVTFEGTFEDQHLCGDPITLTGGLPLGGTYSGTGVSTGMFDPSVAGPGTWTITYTYTDVWGCTNSATNSITVMQPEIFTYFVGVGGDFENLTGENGLFDFLNSNRRCGDVYALVLNDLTEDGTHGLNQSVEVIPGGYNLTIWPIDEAQKLISGNVAQALIRLNGMDRMTIDGGIFWPYRALKFRNDNAQFPTLLINNGVNNLNISGCEIEGNNTNTGSGVVVLESVGGSNNYHLFYRNIIGNILQSPNAPANLFVANGSGSNANISLNTNEFRNYSTNGIFVTSSGNGSNWNIFNNSFYATLVFSGTQTGINFIPGSSSSSNIINTNYIGGSNYQIYGDNFVNTGSTSFTGIYVKTGGVTISKNSVGNIKLSNTGAPVFTGIEVNSGAATIDQSNIIGSLNVLYSITLAGPGTFYGIRSLSTSAVVIKKNVVSNINFSSNLGAPKAYCYWLKRGTVDQNRVYSIGSQFTTMAPWIYGIYTESSGTTNTITNNMIALKGGNSANPKLFGLYDKSISTTNTYRHNTVNIQGAAYAAATNLSAALYREGLATFNLYNNILHNAKASTASAKHWAFYSTSTGTLNSNYNDLVTASPNLVYWGGTSYFNLSTWKTATRDYNSINVVPVYTSTIDLHLTAINSGINNKGTGAYSLATDFDEAPRSATTPDIGCDEFAGIATFLEPEIVVDEVTEPSFSIYPNPMSTSAMLVVSLPENSQVNIQIFNLLGELVYSMDSKLMTSGSNFIEFDAMNLEPGMYICNLTINQENSIIKRFDIIR
jgi:hypothetical protein